MGQRESGERERKGGKESGLGRPFNNASIYLSAHMERERVFEREEE